MVITKFIQKSGLTKATVEDMLRAQHIAPEAADLIGKPAPPNEKYGHLFASAGKAAGEPRRDDADKTGKKSRGS